MFIRFKNEIINLDNVTSMKKYLSDRIYFDFVNENDACFCFLREKDRDRVFDGIFKALSTDSNALTIDLEGEKNE